jgi:sugar phosphate isomerase/epimerase
MIKNAHYNIKKMKRRDFVLKTSIITTSMAAPFALNACTTNYSIKKNIFGIQLYSLRDEMTKDPKGTLEKLASYGYKYIEGYEGKFGLFWGMTNIEFKKYLDDLGMKMISSHCGNTDNLESFQEKSAQAGEIGMEYLICPYAKGDRTIDQFKKNAEKFNKCGEIAQNNGTKFAYHNHDYSFKKINGEYLQDILMNNTDKNLVDFEMDIYWVVAAGEDPIEWFNKHPERFKYCHVKDYLSLSENKFESCTLGKGSIDFSSILAHGKTKGLSRHIIEQEAYRDTSQFESAKDNFNYMQSLKV